MAGESLTVEVSRRIDAPPERVFDAWLDADGVGRWLFATPDGVMERCEIDPRIGGGFRIEERRGGEIAAHYGEYVEVERPHRLVFAFWTSFSAERTRVTVTIAPDGDGSRLTLTHEGIRADWVDKTRQGWAMILARLAKVAE